MVNEFVYCPRLFWLEYVEREFASSYDTVDGERVHRRVDTPTGELQEKVAAMRAAATSVELSSERFGVVAKIDVVEAERDGVVPVDFKRGKVPAIDGGVYDPERVQLGLAVILLREAGYSCDVGRSLPKSGAVLQIRRLPPLAGGEAPHRPVRGDSCDAVFRPGLTLDVLLQNR